MTGPSNELAKPIHRSTTAHALLGVPPIGDWRVEQRGSTKPTTTIRRVEPVKKDEPQGSLF